MAIPVYPASTIDAELLSYGFTYKRITFMPRPKVSEENRKIIFPLRLKKSHGIRLRELARTFGISPGDWVEAQIEPYIVTKSRERPSSP
jgi:hypothetical protein